MSKRQQTEVTPLRETLARTRSARGRAWLRDIASYFAIAAALSAAAMLYGWHQAKAGRSPSLPTNWIGFGAVTAMVFADSLRDRQLRQRPRFWLAISVVCLAQCLLGALILWRMSNLPTLWWALFLPLDYMAIGASMRAMQSVRRH